MEDMYGLSSMDFHSTRATYLWAAPEGPIFKKRRPTQSPYMPPYSMVITQIPGGKLITLDHFHQGRDSILFLLESNTSSEIGFAFPDKKHLKLPSVDLQNILSTVLVFHIALLWSGTHFKAQVLPFDSWNSLMFMEFTGLTVFLIILKQLVWKNGEMLLWRPSQH